MESLAEEIIYLQHNSCDLYRRHTTSSWWRLVADLCRMEFNGPYWMPWGPYSYGWEQLQGSLSRTGGSIPGMRNLVPESQMPVAEDLSTTRTESENSGPMKLEDRVDTSGQSSEQKPFECVLLKEEKREDHEEMDAPTETQMFDCVRVKHEPLVEISEDPEPVGEQASDITMKTENSHLSCVSNPAEQSEAASNTEEAPHAVADETVTERSLPTAHEIFRDPTEVATYSQEDNSQPLVHLNHTVVPEGSDCFSRNSPESDRDVDETAASQSPAPSPETQGVEISCRVCGEVFASAHSLAEHVCYPASDGKTPFLLCELCGEVAYSAEQLADHNSRLHNKHDAINEDLDDEEDGLASNYCEPVYNRDESEEIASPVDMSKSVRRKRSKDRFPRARRAKILLKCNLCGKIYGRKHELNNHMCIKVGDLPKESVASVGAPTSEGESSVTSSDKTSTLLPNVSSHVPPPGTDRPYACDVCGKSFPKPCQLNYHMRTHTGERPFDCSICGKKFAKRAHLNVHTRTHTGARLHACEICGKSFVESCKRNRHMLSHKGEKSFVCNICGKAYMFSSSLSSHKRSHTGDKLNECEVCGKFFPRPSVLKVHLRSHTGEKPHQCPVCWKSFTQVGNLKRHVQAHLSGTLQT